jgi:putative peptide zinc metalloprotease protein
MARSLFSSSWHSVASLTPRLIAQAHVERHMYRGKVWYVVQEKAGGKYHRLSAAAYRFVQGMDGRKTIQSLWEQANEKGEGDECTQNEVVDLLVQLHRADLLQINTNPDSAALLHRLKEKKRATLKQYFLNPMSLKLPLIDPDAFLSKWAPACAWLFTWRGAVLWLMVVLPAVLLGLIHQQELGSNWSDQLLSGSNLLIMFLVFPVVKLLHEFGHGFAVKVWGGDVREMGLMFLVFAPVPYVNASSAAIFPSKTRRAVVAAAGMITEVFVASIAMFVWVLVEPGLIRAVAYNTMLIAGISTLIVNGNPLLRYDAYFILCDLIEMPNLAQRGQKYLTYLWDRYVFKARDLDLPNESSSEKRWLFCYTPLAWCYRTFVTVSILLFVAGEFFIIGVLIAAWGVVNLILTPLYKAYKHVASSPGLERVRTRAKTITLGLFFGVLAFAFLVPMPLHTQTQGVLWLPEQAIVRAGTPGFFKIWLKPVGSPVRQGDPLFLMENPELQARFSVAESRLEKAKAEYLNAQFKDLSQSNLAQIQLDQAQTELDKLQQQIDKLIVFAQIDGILMAHSPQNTPDTYLAQGAMVAHVLDQSNLIARAVVSQDDIDLVQSDLISVDLRFANQIGTVYFVDLKRQAPAAVDELPSPALGMNAGGDIPTSPQDAQGLQTLKRIFLVDLDLPVDAPYIGFGERVHIRFNHSHEPLGWQAARRLRQLFLGLFGV